METVRARQVAGNAPWEMKSLCPQQCVSREQRIKRNEERQNEEGREKCIMRAEGRAGNVFSSLQLPKFINTPLIFRDRSPQTLYPMHTVGKGYVLNKKNTNILVQGFI